MGIGRSSLVSEDRGGGNGTTMAGCPYSEGQVAGTAALVTSIVLSEPSRKLSGYRITRRRVPGKLMVQGVQPAGAGLKVGAGVAQTVEKSSEPLVAGLADARAELRLIL